MLLPWKLKNKNLPYDNEVRYVFVNVSRHKLENNLDHHQINFYNLNLIWHYMLFSKHNQKHVIELAHSFQKKTHYFRFFCKAFVFYFPLYWWLLSRPWSFTNNIISFCSFLHGFQRKLRWSKWESYLYSQDCPHSCGDRNTKLS